MMRTLTVLLVPVRGPDELDGMRFVERRERSGGWTRIDLLHAAEPDAIARRALDLGHGVYAAPRDWDAGEIVETSCIFRDEIAGAAAGLARHVAQPAAAAARLVTAAATTEDAKRVARALVEKLTDPARGPAEEAASFIRIVLAQVPEAKRLSMAIAWEIRTRSPCPCAVWEGTTLGQVSAFPRDEFETLAREQRGATSSEGRLRCIRCGATFSFESSLTSTTVSRDAPLEPATKPQTKPQAASQAKTHPEPRAAAPDPTPAPAPWPPGPKPPSSVDDAERLLRSTAHGPPSFGEDDPWDFVLRWPEKTIATLAWPAISRLLEDENPGVRARAVAFIGVWPRPIAFERLVDVVTTRRDLYEASANDVAFVLANLSVSLRNEAPRIARVILALLGDAPPQMGTTVIAEHEPVALIARAHRWTNDARCQSAVMTAASAMALFRRDHLLDLLAALRARTEEHRKEILAEIEAPLRIPDDKLALILSTAGLGWPKRSPTLDECRRALGL